MKNGRPLDLAPGTPPPGLCRRHSSRCSSVTVVTSSVSRVARADEPHASRASSTAATKRLHSTTGYPSPNSFEEQPCHAPVDSTAPSRLPERLTRNHGGKSLETSVAGNGRVARATKERIMIQHDPQQPTNPCPHGPRESDEVLNLQPARHRCRGSSVIRPGTTQPAAPTSVTGPTTESRQRSPSALACNSRPLSWPSRQ